MGRHRIRNEHRFLLGFAGVFATLFALTLLIALKGFLS